LLVAVIAVVVVVMMGGDEPVDTPPIGDNPGDEPGGNDGTRPGESEPISDPGPGEPGPGPDDPGPIDEPGPGDPGPIDEPGPGDPGPIDEPGPGDPGPIDEPGPGDPGPIDEPGPGDPGPIDEPGPGDPEPDPGPVDYGPVQVPDDVEVIAPYPTSAVDASSGYPSSDDLVPGEFAGSPMPGAGGGAVFRLADGDAGTLPAGTLGATYPDNGRPVVISAGSRDAVLVKVSPRLPTGMRLDERTGAISGTPVAATSGNYTFFAVDAAGAIVAQRTLELDVLPDGGEWVVNGSARVRPGEIPSNTAATGVPAELSIDVEFEIRRLDWDIVVIGLPPDSQVQRVTGAWLNGRALSAWDTELGDNIVFIHDEPFPSGIRNRLQLRAEVLTGPVKGLLPVFVQLGFADGRHRRLIAEAEPLSLALVTRDFGPAQAAAGYVERTSLPPADSDLVVPSVQFDMIVNVDTNPNCEGVESIVFGTTTLDNVRVARVLVDGETGRPSDRVRLRRSGDGVAGSTAARRLRRPAGDRR
jgi:hypothetical protein